MNQYVETKPGRIVNLDGEKVGTHDGIAFFTLGQRKGLGIGGDGMDVDPYFVVAKNKEKNELVVARGLDHPALHSPYLIAKDMNWFAGETPALDSERKFKCTAKSRYRQVDQACTVTVIESGLNGNANGGTIRVDFDEAQRALTPGQYVVLYSGEVCLGGGVIHEVGPSLYVSSKDGHL